MLLNHYTRHIHHSNQLIKPTPLCIQISTPFCLGSLQFDARHRRAARRLVIIMLESLVCVGPKGTRISVCMMRLRMCAVDYVSAFLNASNNYYIAYTNTPAGVAVPFLGFQHVRQETACLNISVDCHFPWKGCHLSIIVNYFWCVSTLILLGSDLVSYLLTARNYKSS